MFFLFLLLCSEAEWRGMEQRQTGGKADEWGIFQWDERVQHVEESKKAGDGGRKEGPGPGSAGLGGGAEELADFANPSFMRVKPSSAEFRLADITEPSVFTQVCLAPPLAPPRPRPWPRPLSPLHEQGVHSPGWAGGLGGLRLL